MITGFDLSHWEGVVDFAKAAAAGIRFSYTKATQGIAYRDDTFRANHTGALAAGIPRGAYHFLDPRYGGVMQADYFWSVIQGDPGELPPCVDYEELPGYPTPKNYLATLTTFIERIEQLSGRKPVIYTGLSFWQAFGSPDPKWSEYPLWLAHPDGTPPAIIPAPWADWTIWQHAWNGDGAMYGTSAKGVDLNYITEARLQALSNLPVAGGVRMWQDNALLAAFDPISGYAAVESIDFAALKAAGIHAVLLQCGGASDTLFPDDPIQGGTQNPKYAAWLRAAQAAGLRVLVDYKFSAVLDSVHGYTGTITNRHLNYLLSGGNKPAKGGGLLFTCEENTWQESIRSVTCTSNMYGQDLNNVVVDAFKTFGLVGGVRTGRWFLDQQDESGSPIGPNLTFLDNLRRDNNGPLFMARLKKPVGVTASADFHSLIADVPDPHLTYVKINAGTPAEKTVEEQAYFLYYGNYCHWNGWELAWVRHAAVKDKAGQPALFRLILWDGKPADFDAYWNFPAAEEEPGGGGEETGGGEEPADPALVTRVAALEAAVEKLEAFLRSIPLYK